MLRNQTMLGKFAYLTLRLEGELKRLGRWSENPLRAEQLENMGAFGQNTMPFEHWLQFILFPRLFAIVNELSPIPEGSSLSVYAVQNFDGDSVTSKLCDLLLQLDEVIIEANAAPTDTVHLTGPPNNSSLPDSFTILQDKLPEVIFELIPLLHQFEGDDLESQLQTYDSFLPFVTPACRAQLGNMMRQEAQHAKVEAVRLRILESSDSILKGGRAATPYNHQEAMRKYREQHRKNFLE